MSQPVFPGNVLRERREALGMDWPEVDKHIHVPVRYLEAFERGNLRALPSHTYAAGFLTTYCRFLDLDPDPFLDSLRSCTQSPGAVGRFLGSNRDDNGGRPEWFVDAMTWGAICALLVLSWLTYSVVVAPFAKSAEMRVNAGAVEVLAPSNGEDDF